MLEREDGQRIAMPAVGRSLIADSADRLTRERGGQAGWCGPAAIALAAGCGYAEACALLRRVAPERYAGQPDIVTAYWRDVLEALRQLGLPGCRCRWTRTRARPHPAGAGPAQRAGAGAVSGARHRPFPSAGAAWLRPGAGA
ncbi:hypothetical protein ACFQU7_14330 [Pseudoroseomonas wenyumeiae]